MENSIIQEKSDFNNITNLTDNRLEINNESATIQKKENPTLLDKVISEYGYGLELWKIIICITLICTVEGYSGTIFATMITAYTKIFNLSDGETGTIGLIYFLNKAFGGLSSGYFTNLLKGRVLLFHICLVTIFTTNLLLALLLTKPMLYLERIFSGISSGILEPIMGNLLCEYLPIKYRGFTLLAVCMGYNLGQLFPNLIMLGTMPHFETTGISKTLLLSNSLLFLSIIVSLVYLKDSARNYILHSKEEKGLNILEKITTTGKLTEEEKKQILKEVQDGVNKNISTSSPLDLFNKEYLCFTIYVFIFAFISNFIYDGPLLIMNLTLTDVKGDSSEDNILRNAIIIILFSIPSPLIGGISFEIKFFGRRRTIFLSFVFLIISLILILIFTQYIYIFLGIYQFFSNYCSNMAIIYSSEVFPSKIRDFSVGLTVFFIYLGSALSQLVFISLHSFSLYSPYYLTIFFCVVGCIISCLLTVETYQRPLDLDDIQESERENGKRKKNNNMGEDESFSLLERSE